MSTDRSLPVVRPGQVESPEPRIRLVAYFPNAAQGNLAVQWLGTLGARQDRLGVTPPDRMEGGQGMILSIPCADEAEAARFESPLKRLGARVYRQSSPG